MCIGIERLALDDADGRQHAERNPASARLAPSLSTSCLSWSKALPSLTGSMLAGTPEASGNTIGLAVALPFSG